MSINPTNIETCHVTWNPITGCLHDCDYCYARDITKRFPKNYPNGFMPTYYPERLHEPDKLKGNKIIFTVSMGDMFGDWVDYSIINKILEVIYSNPNHVFQILTKNPYRMTEYFDNMPCICIPDNLWLGTTVDSCLTVGRLSHLPPRLYGGLRFASFEPLLSPIPHSMIDFTNIDWIWIGARTNPMVLPDKEWIDEIVDTADEHNIRIFMKNSLKPVCGTLRKEFPYNYDIQK